MPYVNNDDIKIYYEVIGNGPPIMFHNGYGNSVEDWYELGYVSGLKDHYQLIFHDGRGYGKSSKPHDPELYREHLRTSDTITLMNHLGIEKAIAFGNSMGGRMVYALMKYYPERFSCFIAAGMQPFGFGQSELGKNFRDWLKQGMEYTVDQIEKQFGLFPANLRERYLQNDPKAMLATYALPQEDISTAPEKIQVPIFLYAGSEDPIVPKMKEAYQLCHNAKIHLIEGFDHGQAYWCGDIASEIIKSFLDSVKT